MYIVNYVNLGYKGINGQAIYLKAFNTLTWTKMKISHVIIHSHTNSTRS